MSPKPPDPAIRTALIDAAARVLVEEGPGALTTRRLATEVGTSTMAVYTYFRGMDDLKRELRSEGFARLAAFQAMTPQTDDVVANVIAHGLAYFSNAIANSHLYRFMFMEQVPEEGTEAGRQTFEAVVAAVARAVEAGRFRGDPEAMATQLWASSHGVVSLALSGLLTLEEAIQTARDVGANLMVAFGEDRETVTRLVDESMEAFQAIKLAHT